MGVLQRIQDFFSGSHEEDWRREESLRMNQFLKENNAVGAGCSIAAVSNQIVEEWLSKTGIPYVVLPSKPGEIDDMQRIAFVKGNPAAPALSLLSAIYKKEAGEVNLDVALYKSVVDTLKDGIGLDAFDDSSDPKFRMIFQKAKELDAQAQHLFANYTASERESFVSQGQYLSILVGDPDPAVRAKVALEGHYLEVLNNDENKDVRACVASKGYALDRLINDPEPDVRLGVAEYWVATINNNPDNFTRENASAIHQLIHDLDSSVRCFLASNGYGLDSLVCDPDPTVRFEVAKQGYGFDVLRNDSDVKVRDVVWALEHRGNKTFETVLGRANNLSKEDAELTAGLGKGNIEPDIELS